MFESCLDAAGGDRRQARGARQPDDAAALTARRLGRVDGQIAHALQHLSELLSDFDAAAINHFEDLRPSLRGLVSQARIEDLQRAIHGFDFMLAQYRLQPLAADLCVPLRETT